MDAVNLEIAEFVYKQAKSLADRWVLAWDDRTYRGGACCVELDFTSKVIRFRPAVIDGISYAYSPIQIPFSYFEDSSMLEADSITAKNKEREEANLKSTRLSQLENSAEVMEYKKIKGYHPFGDIWFL